MPARFNSYMLLIARQARAMSQLALADKIGISHAYISRLENDLTVPNEEIIDALSNILNFPQSFFFQPETIYSLPISVHKGLRYRKKSRIKKSVLDMLHSHINLNLMHLKKLLQSIDIFPTPNFPRLEVDEYGGNIEEIASLVRRTWFLPPGPVKNMTECLEAAGIVVLSIDLRESGISGLSMEIKGLPPCIFINKNEPPDRQRLTMAHELGHLVMHEFPNPDMEDQAYEFAAAFLMPEREIRSYFDCRINLERLAYLKRIWRVSMAALIMRARKINMITESQKTYLFTEMSRRRMRKIEPVEIESESPHLLRKLFNFHLEKLQYKTHELAKTLHFDEEEMREKYDLPSHPKNAKSPHIRMVK